MVPSRHEEESFSLLQSFWYFSIVAIQVGVEKHPKSIGGKILTFAWSFFTLVLVATYTANLAAFFSENVPNRPLRSIYDIPNSKYNAVAFQYEREFLEASNNEVLRQLTHQKRIIYDLEYNKPDEKRMAALIETKLNSGLVWIAVSTQIDQMKRRLPDLYFLDGYFSYVGYGFAMKRDWKWAYPIKKRFMRFGRNGLFYKLKQAYAGTLSKERTSKSSKAIDVDGYFELLLVMLVVGAMSSLLTIFRFVYLKIVSSRSVVISQIVG